MSGETGEAREREIAAIFARLRAEIGYGRDGLAIGAETRGLAARPQAERTWAVSAERPVERPPSRRGRVHTWVFAPVKRMLRKLMRWYVEPLAAQQRSFNLTMLNLLDELTQRLDVDVRGLEERLEALEKQCAPDRPDRDG
jgi:hypothetical protein